MTKSFSERYGYIPPRPAQVEDMDQALRNALADIALSECQKTLDDWDMLSLSPDPDSIVGLYWSECEKKSVYELRKSRPQTFEKQLLTSFRSADWHLVYGWMEFFRGEAFKPKTFDQAVNKVLTRENAGYRLGKRGFVPITGPAETAEVDAATKGSGSSADHMSRALELLSVTSADFRNAIKEAVQAVEAEVRLTSGKENATLGEALKGTRDTMHPALRKAAEGLWGYSSEDGGIRHAKLEGDTDPTRDEARFCIVTCSALVNLLRAQRVDREQA